MHVCESLKGDQGNNEFLHKDIQKKGKEIEGPELLQIYEQAIQRIPIYFINNHLKAFKLQLRKQISLLQINRLVQQRYGIQTKSQVIYLNGQPINLKKTIKLNEKDILHISQSKENSNQSDTIKTRIRVMMPDNFPSFSEILKIQIPATEKVQKLKQILFEIIKTNHYQNQNLNMYLMQSGRIISSQLSFVENEVPKICQIICLLSQNQMKTTISEDENDNEENNPEIIKSQKEQESSVVICQTIIKKQIVSDQIHSQSQSQCINNVFEQNIQQEKKYQENKQLTSVIESKQLSLQQNQTIQQNIHTNVEQLDDVHNQCIQTILKQQVPEEPQPQQQQSPRMFSRRLTCPILQYQSPPTSSRKRNISQPQSFQYTGWSFKKKKNESYKEQDSSQLLCKIKVHRSMEQIQRILAQKSLLEKQETQKDCNQHQNQQHQQHHQQQQISNFITSSSSYQQQLQYPTITTLTTTPPPTITNIPFHRPSPLIPQRTMANQQKMIIRNEIQKLFSSMSFNDQQQQQQQELDNQQNSEEIIQQVSQQNYSLSQINEQSNNNSNSSSCIESSQSSESISQEDRHKDHKDHNKQIAIVNNDFDDCQLNQPNNTFAFSIPKSIQGLSFSKKLKKGFVTSGKHNSLRQSISNQQ